MGRQLVSVKRRCDAEAAKSTQFVVQVARLKVMSIVLACRKGWREFALGSIVVVGVVVVVVVIAV